jgi:hypothetical protein
MGWAKHFQRRDEAVARRREALELLGLDDSADVGTVREAVARYAARHDWDAAERLAHELGAPQRLRERRLAEREERRRRAVVATTGVLWGKP